MSLAYDQFMANLEEDEAMGERQWTLEVVMSEEESERQHAARLGRPMPWGRVHRRGTHNIETNLADARLIAAAPDLLATLVTVAADYANMCDEDDEESEGAAILRKIRAAIRKATDGS